ncbi:hypothetical protein [Cetobacterium sp.]|uniref:hypothetical protein n=1 Tax=Cetobacterium sp. TaxID=2071632 RepID=UPI003F31E39D
MEKDYKILLGKILGEVYELQGEYCKESEGTIYGLKNGFEFVLDEVIKSDYKITNEDYNNFVKILDEIYYNKENLENFKGYYCIEEKMQKVNIDREKANYLFTYFKKNGGFYELIVKLDSNDSPSELRTFE